ncbi:hypothetical protein GCM10023238_40720 [Streptomyces heliomycini]
MPLQGQGESVTYSADGSRLLYGSEGGQSPVEAREAPGGDSGDGGGKGARTEGGESAAGDGSGNGNTVKVVAAAVVVAGPVRTGPAPPRG